MSFPLSVNVAENQTASVNCTAIADYINFLFNEKSVRDFGTKFHESDPMVINGTRMKTLTFVASSDVNGSNLSCIATQSGSIDRQSAPIFIQGNG